MTASLCIFSSIVIPSSVKVPLDWLFSNKVMLVEVFDFSYDIDIVIELQIFAIRPVENCISRLSFSYYRST